MLLYYRSPGDATVGIVGGRQRVNDRRNKSRISRRPSQRHCRWRTVPYHRIHRLRQVWDCFSHVACRLFDSVGKVTAGSVSTVEETNLGSQVDQFSITYSRRRTVPCHFVDVTAVAVPEDRARGLRGSGVYAPSGSSRDRGLAGGLPQKLEY